MRPEWWSCLSFNTQKDQKEPNHNLSEKEWKFAKRELSRQTQQNKKLNKEQDVRHHRRGDSIQVAFFSGWRRWWHNPYSIILIIIMKTTSIMSPLFPVPFAKLGTSHHSLLSSPSSSQIFLIFFWSLPHVYPLLCLLSKHQVKNSAFFFSEWFSERISSSFFLRIPGVIIIIILILMEIVKQTGKLKKQVN